MTFNPNIPQGNQTISSTTNGIQTNFSQSNTAFGIDHTPFNVPANQGMHKQVTFQNVLSVNPNQATPIATLYTKVSPSTSTSDLYYQNGALSANVVQVTGGGITTAAWCQFNGATTTINASYNIASLVKNSTANYTINFTRNFSSSSYAVVATGTKTTVPSFAVVPIQITRAVGSCVLNFGTTQDLPDVNVVIFGTLA